MKGLVLSGQLDRQMQIKVESLEYIFGSQREYICVETSITIVKYRCSTKSMMSLIGFLIFWCVLFEMKKKKCDEVRVMYRFVQRCSSQLACYYADPPKKIGQVIILSR